MSSPLLDLCLTGPGQLVTRPLDPPPTAPRAGEVLVEVDCVSLCGSDRALFRGTYAGPRRYPIRFGHEWSGTVLAAGAGAGDLDGAPVTGDCSRWCGACDLCAIDRNLCRRIEKFGLTVDGFSVRRRLVDRRYVYPDPYGLDPRLRALTEPFAVALHGLRRVLSGPTPDALLVVGGGPIGLACHLLATRYFGVREVHLVEADPVRAATIRSVLPDVTLVPGVSDEPVTYAEIAGAARYPVVVESAGSAAALATAFTLADLQGQVLCLGLGNDGGPARLVVAKSLRVHGSIGGTGAFAEAMAFLHQHPGPARALLTSCHPAAEAAAAFAAAEDRTQLKSQLTFQEVTS